MVFPMSYDPHGPDGMDPSLPESLLPYDKWLDEAQRDVMLQALEHVSRDGLPGEHHFYITFRTQDEAVRIPPHLKARYPLEMTIVLQHQFDNLTVDRTHNLISVGLSFGGAHSILSIPFASILSFTDPYLHLMLRFNPVFIDSPQEAPPEETPAEIHTLFQKHPKPTEPENSPEPSSGQDIDHQDKAPKEAEIVSLSAFRKKPPHPPTES